MSGIKKIFSNSGLFEALISSVHEEERESASKLLNQLIENTNIAPDFFEKISNFSNEQAEKVTTKRKPKRF